MGFDTIDRQFRQHKHVPAECRRCGSGDRLTLHNVAAEGEDLILLCAPCVKFHEETMTPRWFWAVGEYIDLADYETCDTREEAITAAKTAASEAEADQITVLYSKPLQYDDDVFFGRIDDILSWWDELNGGNTAETTITQDADLENMLKATFTAWRLKHRIGRCEGPADEETAETIAVATTDGQ